MQTDSVSRSVTNGRHVSLYRLRGLLSLAVLGAGGACVPRSGVEAAAYRQQGVRPAIATSALRFSRFTLESTRQFARQRFNSGPEDALRLLDGPLSRRWVLRGTDGNCIEGRVVAAAPFSGWSTAVAFDIRDYSSHVNFSFDRALSPFHAVGFIVVSADLAILDALCSDHAARGRSRFPQCQWALALERVGENEAHFVQASVQPSLACRSFPFSVIYFSREACVGARVRSAT
jgi:hypothetical protein